MHGLLIAEKPSVKRAVEAVYKKEAGKLPFTLDFAAFHGHLMQLLEPADYNPAWSDWSNLPVIPDAFRYKADDVILYPGINKDDAKYYSDQFGEYEKVEQEIRHSRKTFNLLTGGFDKLGHPTEMTAERKTMTANYTTTDLIYGQNQGSSFGEITYTIIKNNSLQPAKVGLITYIPRELNDKLDEEIAKYSAEFARETAADAAAHKREEEKKEQENPYGGLTFGDDSSTATPEEGMSGGGQGAPMPLDFGMEDSIPEPAPESTPALDPADIPIDWGDPLPESIVPAGPEIDLRSMDEEISVSGDGDEYSTIDDLLG